MTSPAAICVQCFVVFPVSREEDEWIKNGEGQRVLCPACWHQATGVDAATNGQPGAEEGGP